MARLEALTRTVHADDRELLRSALNDLAIVGEGNRHDLATARDLVRELYGPMLQDRTQRIELGATVGSGTATCGADRGKAPFERGREAGRRRSLPSCVQWGRGRL